jgi:hypothetical protein
LGFESLKIKEKLTRAKTKNAQKLRRVNESENNDQLNQKWIASTPVGDLGVVIFI